MAACNCCDPEDEFTDKYGVSTREKKLVLAYHHLTTVPDDVIIRYGDWLEILDLSHNKITDLSFLIHFPNLKILILDHNKLTSDIHFPGLPKVQTLWINYNHIDELWAFFARLGRSLPNLRYLSMMKNPATPSSFGVESYTQYVMYRYYAISFFEKLELLDDQKITTKEREEAVNQFKNLKLLQFLLPITPKFPECRENKIV
ncbi:hypothetical protein CHUAL_004984 [Chamberlinius hualienensis]